MFITDDPIADAERYYNEQEDEFARVNATAYCECCGKACGAEDHYKIFGQIACSKECARKLIMDEDIEEVIDEWIEMQTAVAGEEDPERW